MAGEEERWEYSHASWISEGSTAQRVSAEANAHLKQWSEAGWELFSAQASPYVLMSSSGGGGGGGLFTGIVGSKSRCFVYHVMIWRRRVGSPVTKVATAVGGNAPPPERQPDLGWEPFHSQDR